MNECLKNYFDTDIPALFEAVYYKKGDVVEETFLHLLEKILKRHPHKPRENDGQAQHDYRILEMLLADFDGVYFDWLKASNLPYKDDDRPVNPEMNDTLLNSVTTEGLQIVNFFIYSSIHYLDKDTRFYFDQPQLLNALGEYKSHKKVALLNAEPPFHDTSALPGTRIA